MYRLIFTIWTCVLIWLASVAYSQEQVVTREEFESFRQSEIQNKQQRLLRQRRLEASKTSAVQNNFDVKYYKLDLLIDPFQEQISGTMKMRAAALTDGLNSINLDLYANMQVNSVSEDAANYNHVDDVLQIQLSKARQQGELFTINVNYMGRPASTGFGSFGFNYHDLQPIIWSLSEPYGAKTWWPCKDVPNDKADSVDIIITVPDDLIAASNGKLLSNVDNGDGSRTFHWQESYPITTYLVSLAITNYATYSEWIEFSENESMEVQYYIYPEDLKKAQSELTETLAMLAYFHQIFGPYPFIREKYGIAQFPRGGGMEHQTITSQGGASRFSVALTVHELAHQWWGNKITNANWHEIWLNEGFASYAEALYFEHSRSKDFYHTYMNWKDWNFPHPIFVDDTTKVSRIFHKTVYDKGAWFLHMLRHVVGDSTFFEILLDYSDDPRFAYGNATTAGFQNVCETVSGQDLDWFFQPWIYEKGRPVYQAQWSTEDSAEIDILNLRIKQLQYSQQALFPMPLDITVETVHGDTLVTVFNDQPEQDFKFHLSARPTGIILDKEGWILKRVDSVTFVENIATDAVEFSLQQNYPNPFNSETIIIFSLPQREKVELSIYNIYGQLVRTLSSQSFDAGTHRISWNGHDEQNNLIATGLYIYQLRAGEFKRQKKLLFIK